MASYVIRNQGFFYTDEYFAPADVFKAVARRTYASREEAEAALVGHNRRWLRQVRLGNYLFDDREANTAVLAYLRETWPDAFGGATDVYDLGALPRHATDAQVDEVLRRSKIVPAVVFEVGAGDADGADADDAADDEFAFGPVG